MSEELGCHILELPYTGDAISMYILLPPFITGKHGFNSMVSRVNGSLLHDAFENMWRTQVEVIIPKFKMEQMLENELIQVRGRVGEGRWETDGWRYEAVVACQLCIFLHLVTYINCQNQQTHCAFNLST